MGAGNQMPTLPHQTPRAANVIPKTNSTRPATKIDWIPRLPNVSTMPLRAGEAGTPFFGTMLAQHAD
eukprot:10548430-Lingulodinium_polyedra.AAC.1